MSVRNTIRNFIKRIVSGGSQKKTAQKSTSQNRSSNSGKSSKRASSDKDEKTSVRRAYVSAATSKKELAKQQRKEPENKFKASKSEYKSAGDSVRSSAPKAVKGEDYKQTLIRNARSERDIRRNAFHEAVNSATGNKYNVDVKDKAQSKAARQRIKSGDLISDPVVAKKSFEYYPTQNLAGRKFAQGLGFGVPDLVEQKFAGDKYRESTNLYRKEQEKHPWISAGSELAGGLVGFGMTGGMSKDLVSAVAPNAIKEGATKFATDRLINSNIVQKIARREAIKAAQEGLISGIDDVVMNEFSRNVANRIISAVGEDMAINMTTGALADTSNAFLEARYGGDVKKSLEQSLIANAALGTLTTIPPALRSSKGIINRTLRNDTREFVERLMAEGRFEEAAEALARSDAQEAVANEVKNAVDAEPALVKDAPTVEGTKAEPSAEMPDIEPPKVVPAKERLFIYEVKNSKGELKQVTVRAKTKQEARRSVTSRDDVKTAMLVDTKEIPAKKNADVKAEVAEKPDASAKSEPEVIVAGEKRKPLIDAEERRKRSEAKNKEIIKKAKESASGKAPKKKDEVIAKGKNRQTKEDWVLAKDANGRLYVGNPNDIANRQYFGIDIPENRARAQSEFEFTGNVKKKQPRKKYTKVEGETSEIRKLEYGKKMRENRLSELEEEAKGSANLSQREQDKIQNSYVYSLKRKQNLEERIADEKTKVKKLREDADIDEVFAEDSKSGYTFFKDGDGQLVVTDLDDKVKFFKEDEFEKAQKYYDSAVKHAKERAEKKAAKGKGKSKSSKETKAKETKKKETAKKNKGKSSNSSKNKAEEVKPKTESSVKENAKIPKKIKSLQNKIDNTEKNIKRFDDLLEQKRAEGKSEKSIKHTQEQREMELQKQKALKKELSELEKEHNYQSPKEDVSSVSDERDYTPFEEMGEEQAAPVEKAKPSPKEKALKEGASKKPPEKKISKAAQERERKAIAQKRVKSLEKKAKKEQNIYKRGDNESLKDLVNTEAELRQAYRDAGMSRTDEYRALRERQTAHEKELKALEKQAKKDANRKPSDKALETYRRNQQESLPKAKEEAANTENIGGRTYSVINDSPFDEASTRTTREKPKFVSNEEKAKVEEKKANKAKKAQSDKLNKAKNRVKKAPLPRGENLHKGIVKRVTGKPLEESTKPQTVEQMLDGLTRWADGQASGNTETVSLAGIKLSNASTDEVQRARLRELEANDKFNYYRVKNDQKYEDAYREISNNFDAVAKRLQNYEQDMSTLPVTKMVDTHYEAHAMMKYLRKELSNPDLSPQELAKVQRVYDSAACVTQRLSSWSGQTNQFQGVMVGVSPMRRMKNAAENIVDFLDSSRGFRRRQKVEYDGKLTSLAQNATKRRQEIRKLVYNDPEIRKALEKVGKAGNEEEYGEAMEELMLQAYRLNKNSAFDYLQQWRYLAMLGNPKTHFRNILGNIIFGGVRTVSNTLRSGLENAFEGYAARNGLELQMHGGVSAKAAWQAQSEKLAFDDAGKDAWASFNKHKKEILGSKKYDNPETKAFVSQLNSKLLAGEDDFFRQRAYIEQYTKGYYKYQRKGIKITEDIEKRLHEEALRESQVATFNEFSELAQILAKSQRGLYDANATTGQKTVALVSNSLLPFTKVPANILKQSVNYSPAGVLKSFAHIKDAGVKGDSALLNQAIDELASGLTGTAIATAGYLFGKYTGAFTTNAGSEDAAAQFKKRQGVQNYSVMFPDRNGKTKSVTMDWLVPTSSTFFLGVELANQFKNGLEGANMGELVGDLSQVTSRVIDPVLETSMLSGIYNIVENSRKSSSYDDQQSFFSIALRELAQSLVSSYVPTFQGQLARSFAYDSDKFVTGESDTEYFINSMKVKMGLADTDFITDALGEDVNAYGEVKNKKETAADYAKSFVKNAILPWNTQEVDLSEVDKQKIKEYEDYVKEGGDPADKEYLFPKKQYRKEFSYGKTDDNKTDIKLTNKEVSLYNQAKTTGGAEGMRVVLENIMFNRYDKDENGKKTILRNGYTAEQKQQLIQQFDGKSMREVEEWLYKQPQFKTSTEEEKRKALNALWSYSQQGKSQGAKRVGEQAVVADQGKDIDEYNFKNELSKKKQEALDPYIADGILTYGECVEFARLAGKTYYYEDDEGGSAKTYYNKKQMLEYLESKGMSPEKAEALYNAFKASNAKEYGATSNRKGRGRRRRGYRRRGGGGGRSRSTSASIKASDFKADKVTYKDAAKLLQTKSSNKKYNVKTPKATPTVKVEPPKVKMKKYEV